MKVLLTIPLSPFTGYGNDGIGLARAFTRMGADVYLQPTVVQSPLPEDVALLLTKELTAPFDLIINHVDPAALKATPELSRAGDITIGWTMWEYSNFLNLKGRSKLKKNFENFDAMVGYDTVSTECLRPYYKGPLLTVQGGFTPEDWPKVERDWNEENFYFCMVGQLHERKDPFVAVEAFQELKAEHEDFDKHARLSLKTSTPGLHSSMEDWMPGLRVHYEMWSNDLLKKFYAANHVLLAPSRGEGKNMPALEFQSTGGTVIATNWGGHTQWLNPDYNYPLDYTLAPVSTDHLNTLNARASKDHLKQLMLHVFRNRDEARDKGDLAAATIPGLASWDAVVTRLIDRLAEELPQGDKLAAAAQKARQEASHGNG